MSMSTRRGQEIGKADLSISVGEPTYESQAPVVPIKVPPPPTPSLEKRLADDYPWVVEGKPQDSRILFWIWWLFTRLGLYKFDWIPAPREVWSYAKAAEQRKEQINTITASENATGQVSVKSFKGGVGKTNVSAMIAAAARIASGEEVLAMDVNLDGATLLSRFPIEEKILGTGMSTPELVSIYQAAKTQSYEWMLERDADAELRRFAEKHGITDEEGGPDDTDSTELPAPSAEEEREEPVEEEQIDDGLSSDNPPILTPSLRELKELPNRPYKDPVSKVNVVADDYTDIRLHEEDFEDAMEYARQLAYLVVADTPPGADQIATIGVDRKVTLQLRIGRYDQEISLRRVRSMQKDDEVVKPEQPSSAAKKTPRFKMRSRHNTPIVILNATPKRLCNRRTQHKFAERFATVPDHVLPIPFIKDLDKNFINIESYDARTRYHIYDLAYRVFRKLSEINQHNSAIRGAQDS